MYFYFFSGFFFLRFVVPAVIAPERFGLPERALGPPNQRGLLLVAKSLQCFGNFVETPKKEEFMGFVIKKLRESRFDQLLSLPALLCEASKKEVGLDAFRPGFNVALSEFHKILSTHMPELEARATPEVHFFFFSFRVLSVPTESFFFVCLFFVCFFISILP